MVQYSSLSSAQPPLPLCPRCRRPSAAWRLDTCVYCGERFPAGFREGFEEPRALQWIERPALPPEASRQLEVMKVVPLEKSGPSRSLAVGAGLLSLPVFGAVFYLLYRLISRFSAVGASLIFVAGAGFLVYLAWSFFRASRRR